ncbi:MAG: serine/threonine-protein kinase [Rikenellaceae bacterium]
MATVVLKGNGVYYEFDPDNKSCILGQGNMGIVCKGKRIYDDTGKYEYVAIKIMFSDLPEASIDRARKEASIKVSHENILQMYDFIETCSSSGELRYHIISELLEGETLDEYIKTNGLLSEIQTINVIKSLLSALQMLHSKGYIHRDIKPSNIMMCKNGQIKLIDFGIAKLMTTYHDEFKQGTQEGCPIGTIYYASPEQVEGRHWITNSTSDIYSTGILLFELSTGRLPFNGTTYEIINGHRKEAIIVPNSYKADLKYIITKACAKEQKNRYQSASEFIVDLEKYQRGEQVISNNTWVSIIISISAIFVIGIFSFFFMSNNEKKEIEAKSKLTIGQYNASKDIYETIIPIFRTDEAKTNLKILEYIVPAFQYYIESKYNKADSLFRLAAELNSSDAYYYLGEMCFEGIGTPKNYNLGIGFTEKAVELGSSLAVYRLGIAYKYGLGVKIDNTKAIGYFEKAGKVIDEGIINNNPELIFIKGSMYLNGNYVQQNKTKAIEYYTTSAELDYPQAQYELSKIITDDKKAYEYLEKAALQGYPKAEYDMGLIAGEKGEIDTALDWINKSAAHCYSPAFQFLGNLHADNFSKYAESLNLETTLDNVKAHEYAKKALEYDFENIYSMIDLWSDYSVGRGVNVDKKEAEKYKEMITSKLNELSFTETSHGDRIYESNEAQNAWEWLCNNKGNL